MPEMKDYSHLLDLDINSVQNTAAKQNEKKDYSDLLDYNVNEPKKEKMKDYSYLLEQNIEQQSQPEQGYLSKAADLASAIPGSVAAGVAQIGAGAAGIGEAATQALGFESAEKWFDELGDDIKSFQTSVLPKDLDKNKAKYYISGIFQNLATNLPMLALGPIGALAGMASVAGGSKFDEMDDKGYSTTQSILGGIGQGLIEAGTEMLPVGVLFKKMPLAKKAIKTALADLVGEEIATVSEYVMDKYGFDKDITPAELKQRIIDTAIIAVPSGGLMGLTVGTFEKMTAKQKAGLTIELKNELQKPPVQDTAATKLPETEVDLSLLQSQTPQNELQKPPVTYGKENFTKDIQEKFGVSKEEANIATALLDARAESEGVSTDEYINSRIKGVEKGGELTAENANMYYQDGRLNPETSAFKKWFGNSKAVDKTGKPLTLYHGSTTGLGGERKLFELAKEERLAVQDEIKQLNELVDSVDKTGRLKRVLYLGKVEPPNVDMRGFYNDNMGIVQNLAKNILSTRKRFGLEHDRIPDVSSSDLEAISGLAASIENKLSEPIKQYEKQARYRNQPIDAFSERKIGTVNDKGYFGSGFYFSSNKNVADRYAMDLPGSKTYPVYLSINKMYTFGADKTVDAAVNNLVSKYEDKINAPYSESTRKPEINYSSLRTSALKELGYDGILVKHEMFPELTEADEYIVFSPNQIKSVDNRGTFDPQDANIYHQKEQDKTKGAVQFLEDGKAVIKAFNQPDISTVVHEVGHIFRRDLKGTDLKIAELYAGAKDGVWTREAEEKFARGFETYLQTGKSPGNRLTAVFEKLKVWLENIYGKLRGTLPADITGVYDRLLTPKVEQTTSPVEQTASEDTYEGGPVGGQRTFGTIQPDGTVGTPEKVGNIRLFGHDANGVRVDRIEKADDISKILHMTYEANKQEIDEATRGRQSSEQMVLLAHEMGMTESQLLKRLKGQAYNSEEAYAARMVLHSSAQQLNEFVADMGDNPTEQNIAIFRALMAKHAAVQAQVAGIATEAGRALRQFNETAKGAKESLDLANKLVAEFGGKEFNMELLKKAEAIMQTGDMKAINQFFEQAVEAKTSDKLYEIWINSILSNPATHMANVISNALTYVSSLVERGVVPAVELVRSRVTGQKQQRFLGETKAYAIGTMGGFLDAVKVMHQVLKTGVSQFRQGKVEGFNEMGAIKGKKGKLVRTPTRMLQAADDFAKTLVYRAELNALAYRQARIEGKTGADINTRMQEILSANPKTNNILKDMQEKAHYQAEYRTFTKALGVEKDAIQGLRKIPGMRYAIPFTRTPTNIAKYGIERTPLGFLKLFRQDIKTAEWSDEFAAPLVGTAVMAFAYTLAKSGLITGSGPKDKDEREALYRTGWQPNSVNLQAFGGEDAWLRIDRFEPISSLLNMAADVAEQKFDKDTDFSDVFASAAFSISSNLASKTFLSGLNNLMQAMVDPQRYGDNYIKMMAGSVVPGLIAGATRAIEPDLKITKTPTDAIKERIPGLRDSLYSRRDIWGNKIERAGGTGAGGIATRYMFGTGVSSVSQDVADLEMVRLGINKGVPSNKLTIFREQVEMTPAEYDEFQIIAGAEAKRLVDRIAKFNFRSDEAKAKKIKSAIDKARDKARNFISRKIKIRLTKEKQQ